LRVLSQQVFRVPTLVGVHSATSTSNTFLAQAALLFQKDFEDGTAVVKVFLILPFTTLCVFDESRQDELRLKSVL